MSRRRRKSKDFSIPGNPGAAAPPLPLSSVQAQRLGELWLLHCFTGTLWLHWRTRLDALGTLRMVAAVGGPAVSKKDAAEVLESNEEGDEDDGLPTTAMLLAANRWYAGLRLPRTRLQLWSGPPVRERARAGCRRGGE